MLLSLRSLLLKPANHIYFKRYCRANVSCLYNTQTDSSKLDRAFFWHASHGVVCRVSQESYALNTDADVHHSWKLYWGQFLRHLYDAGHFAADEGRVQPDRLDKDKGCVKRAVLSFARQRADLKQKLPLEYLQPLVKAGFPRPDRKSINAYKRLEASILNGADLPAGDGGPADFQDVMRMLYALSVVDSATADNDSPGLANAACNLMPLIISASKEEQSSLRLHPVNTVGLPRPSGGAEPTLPSKDDRAPISLDDLTSQDRRNSRLGALTDLASMASLGNAETTGHNSQ